MNGYIASNHRLALLGRVHCVVSSVALCVTACLAFAAPASAQGAVTGEWTIARTSAGAVEVSFRGDDSGGEHSHWEDSFDTDPARSGLAGADLDSDGKHVHFTLSRDAGSFVCDGWAGHGHAAGTFTFEASAAYLEGLRARGIEPIPVHKALTAATLDLSLSYVDEIVSAGYAHIPFERLIGFRALGVTRQSIAALRSALRADLTQEQVMSLTAVRVTPEYVDDLRTLGVADVSPRSAIEMKALRIDRPYVESLARAGYPQLSEHDLVQLKSLGVDDGYIRRLADHGFHNVPVSDLVRMKALGI
jgi:hypothetical protein